MADYIELKTAIDFIKNNTPTIDGMTTLGCIERALYNAPNADVTEMVRCKDCVYCTDIGLPRCRITGRNTTDDDFCSRGERREGE